MKIGVIKEGREGETRVALIPADIKKLVRKGLEVVVEKGAGAAGGYSDADYEKAGAELGSDSASVAAAVQILVGVNAPEENLLRDDLTIIAQFDSLMYPGRAQKVAGAGATAYALDLVPRTTRAQAMDVMSSMANLAGYKAVLLAADHLTKILPMMTTAAGTIRPSRALILGAGVAGLQAVATAKRLGAVVEAFDTRPVVKEQVESLGGKFVEVPLTEEEKAAAETKGGYARQMNEDYYRRQREIIHKHAMKADMVITTARIFGAKAPVLVTAEMVEDMQPGSVIVDLAVDTGGNCELAVAGENVVRHGVTIIGMENLATSLPTHASQMYSRNIFEFVTNMLDEESRFRKDEDDEILAESVLCRGGNLVHKGTLERSGGES